MYARTPWRTRAVVDGYFIVMMPKRGPFQRWKSRSPSDKDHRAGRRLAPYYPVCCESLGRVCALLLRALRVLTESGPLLHTVAVTRLRLSLTIPVPAPFPMVSWRLPGLDRGPIPSAQSAGHADIEWRATLQERRRPGRAVGWTANSRKCVLKCADVLASHPSRSLPSTILLLICDP
jgi:hypothetical protein